DRAGLEPDRRPHPDRQAADDRVLLRVVQHTGHRARAAVRVHTARRDRVVAAARNRPLRRTRAAAAHRGTQVRERRKRDRDGLLWPVLGDALRLAAVRDAAARDDLARRAADRDRRPDYRLARAQARATNRAEGRSSRRNLTRSARLSFRPREWNRPKGQQQWFARSSWHSELPRSRLPRRHATPSRASVRTSNPSA